MNIGERLKYLRNKQKWTMKDISSKLGIGDSTYSGYETNYRKPDAEMICKLADLHNTTTDYILCKTDDPTLDKATSSNIKDFFDNQKLHWDGKELSEDDVESLKDLLEVAVKRMLK
ncbi:helix-turn-helix transcriptional regulator [Bacillus cereus group sp. BfR-BA-00331]|uniref:helix-turn-helix domain-containing protein n=1 Tax=unclassified Bacillus cereus group TaxID=2750818 RepID=UPI00077249FE|nr:MULTISPECIES: helix-turn-helix transcriptional regulator [unclassified Bacillus cereus group]MDA1631827.1 helix-turn-helix transcriptional regulator [Bacillus cereus]MDA2755994.1 helix-turn-helix transcriptional regulator [Bacillus cereus group sp. Bc007]MDA2762038.1 helix-turn-helix transcriptional regulator [Bacillus cereus group sp. Bc008]MDA2772793.1 helix-turn-helix transcriptional regulator [Bacillus cereus group sp. Bc005]MDX5957018.1 helix-turn-helix transcriptional regulator [Bacil